MLVPYYNYTIDGSLSILENFKNGNEYIQLWTSCLSTIKKYLEFNEKGKIPYLKIQGILDEAKFTKLITALLNQLNLVDEFGEDYVELMSKGVLPCITELAVFTKEESQRKQINKLLCLNTRSSKTQVRLMSVLILKEIYKRIGEPMLNFFPETIPFIAELMEDEELEEVTQDLCLVIQDHLGEPIQQYFTH